MLIKNWVKAARKSARLTQEQLGRALGRTKSNVAHWESGAHLPSYEQIRAISELTMTPLPPYGGRENPLSDVTSGTVSEHRPPRVTDVLTRGGSSMLEVLDASAVPPLLGWNELEEETVPLPPRFRLHMPDEALAPRTPPGLILHFERAAKPRPGDGVLVRDAEGRLYVRLYAQGPRGTWSAQARDPAFVTLESERDGLILLAAQVAREDSKA